MILFYNILISFLSIFLSLRTEASYNNSLVSTDVEEVSYLKQDYQQSPMYYNLDSSNLHKSDSLIEAFQNIPPSLLPSLPKTQMYIKESGTIYPYQHSSFDNGSFFLKLLAPRRQDKVNYILSTKDQHETSANKQKRLYKRKNSPFYKAKDYTYTDIYGRKYKFLDIGHGIDDADQTDGSNDEFFNYIPQNKFYNRVIRNHLVHNLPQGGTYKEIALYSSKPLLTDDGTSIPEGFIFISNYINENKETISKYYYFPNLIDYEEENFVDYINSLSFEEILKYEKYSKVFKINNLESFLKPIIYNFVQNSIHTSKPLEIYRYLFLGFNVHPLLDFNRDSRGIELLKYFGIPFSWKNDFRLYIGHDKQEEIQSEYISIIPSNNTFPVDVSILQCYLGNRAIIEAVKSPFASISLKLIAAKISQLEEKFEETDEWIGLAYHQCHYLGSLNESLKLFQVYLDYKSKSLCDQDLENLSRLIEDKNFIFLEDLLLLNKFFNKNSAQIPKLSNRLKDIKIINPQNTKILRDRIFTSQEVKTLIKIIENVDRLEEFSLFKVAFWPFPEEFTKTIEADEFFWKEQKPFHSLLEILSKKHHSTLRKLDLRQLSFNEHYLIEKNLKNLLDAINLFKFEKLEEIHLTDNLITEKNILKVKKYIEQACPNLKILD